jgi:hypothetical protein
MTQQKQGLGALRGTSSGTEAGFESDAEVQGFWRTVQLDASAKRLRMGCCQIHAGIDSRRPVGGGFGEDEPAG